MFIVALGCLAAALVMVMIEVSKQKREGKERQRMSRYFRAYHHAKLRGPK